MYGAVETAEINKKRVALFDFNNAVNGLIDGHLGKNTLANVCYNFDYSDKALKCGLGIKQLEVILDNDHFVPDCPKDMIPQKIFYYHRFDDINSKKDDRILVLYDSGEVYEWKIYSKSGQMTKVDGLNFQKPPFYINYRLNGEDTIMFSTQKSLYVYNGETVSQFSTPEITSMCIHNERMFATTSDSGTELWFSKTFDPTNWNVSMEEGGFIDFRTKAGSLLKVLSFDGYLYAFCGYGIFRITAYDSQIEMSAESLYINSGRIIKNSVTECGKYVIYLAEDGFYRFDGYNSYRIMPELDRYLKGIANEDISAIYHNGRFYATLNLKINEEVSKMMVCCDLYTNEFYLSKNLNLYDLEKIEGDGFSLLATLSEGYNNLAMISDDGAKFGIPLTKLWKSKPSDYNIYTQKTIGYVSLYTKSDIEMQFESDLGNVSIKIQGSKTRQKKRVGLKGNTFTVTISSKSRNAEVSKVVLELIYL